jgi:alpha-ketoglutarate-dependent taurine dioxygenase
MRFFDAFEHRSTATAVQDFVQALRQHKVVHYRGVPVDIDYKDFYRSLATSAGSFVKRDENFKTGDQSEAQNDWLDIRFDEDMKSLTFRHSDTRQPIHTDGAYTTYHFDISFFFCTVQAQYGGATTFIDGVEVVTLLRKFAPDLLADLESHTVVFDKGDQQRKIERVIRYDDTGPLLNWNHFRIARENSSAVVAMCDAFFEFTEKKIFEAGLLMPITLKPGEAAFFHDERVLHGRNAFFGERCLIKGGINL